MSTPSSDPRTASESHRPSRLAGGLLLALVLLGAGLRLGAVAWNTDRLHGDVFLLAMTAREVAEQGRLEYPVKLDWSERLPYRALRSPASLHPLLFPALAGVASRALGGDVYRYLQALSAAAGLALLALGAWCAARCRVPRAGLAGLALLAVAPVLVDFSGNGSPYVLASAALLAAAVTLACVDRSARLQAALLGGLAALGLEAHGSMVAIPAAYLLVWCAHRRRLGGSALAVFFLVFLALRAPTLAWRWASFGTPLHGLTAAAFLHRFGWVERTMGQEGIFSRTAFTAEPERLLHYAREVGVNAVLLARHLFVEVGPCAALLAAVGLASARRRLAERLVPLVLPTALYLLVLAAWASFETRFAVLLVPAICALAGLGFDELLRRERRAATVVAWLVLAGALGWCAPAYLRAPRSRYYADERAYLERSEQVRRLAEGLRAREPGVVLGFEHTAIEAAWWHRRPHVDLAAPDADLARRVVADFDVRWVWVHERREAEVREWLGSVEAESTLRLGPYAVLRVD